ncbi:PHD finger family protein [Klebsormidium nitens]|uniref:PHD finger family protein n=1 Tax=Klebsormidium nitens TaxID=105231 RepID=A0A1Y1HNI0_KLENI|nr:PHD finger family protein [Klebsormidium nitens]|eukprot:GAQ78729.1 PHD finger family protein [Klebsormidium nitens]
MGGKKQKEYKDVPEYHIKGQEGEDSTVKVGDCVIMRPEAGELPYIGKVEKLFTVGEGKKQEKIKARWYYRPSEAKGGRRAFHGKAELFLSDHYDEVWAEAIMGKCRVHGFKKYIQMEDLGEDDFYCRFEYKAKTGSFMPDKVAVYCTCEMPYNPDDPMVQCEKCRDWYHLKCVGLTKSAVKKLDVFMCDACLKEPQETVESGDENAKS